MDANLRRAFPLDVYDEQIARHYAAYRPPLHRLIVNEALEDQQFEVGLDIGCGTGRSTTALVEKCSQVVGVDYSQHMLDRARKTPKVNYLHGSGENLPIPDASIDLVTFAGVLSYLNKEAVVKELMRVCRNNALILSYDFKILIGDLAKVFSLAETNVDHAYDHASNLSGHVGISTLKRESRFIELSITEKQAAHILLSHKVHYEHLAELFGSGDPFDQIVSKLKQVGFRGLFKVKIYYTRHRLECE